MTDNKPLYEPWKRGSEMTTWVKARVWSELDFRYHDLRWAIRNCEAHPVSCPPLLYVIHIDTY